MSIEATIREAIREELAQAMAGQNLPRLMTVEEVAEALAVSPSQVRAWVQAGRIRKWGGMSHIRISTAEFRRFIAEWEER